MPSDFLCAVSKYSASEGLVYVCPLPNLHDGPHSWVLKQTPVKLGYVPGREDPVNHPKHYSSHPSGIECIEITRHLNFNVGNAIKYLWRAGIKDEDTHIQDLEKAIWYIKDEIERLKKSGQST